MISLDLGMAAKFITWAARYSVENQENLKNTFLIGFRDF
jgi:hypothetical protein